MQTYPLTCPAWTLLLDCWLGWSFAPRNETYVHMCCAIKSPLPRVGWTRTRFCARIMALVLLADYMGEIIIIIIIMGPVRQHR